MFTEAVPLRTIRPPANPADLRSDYKESKDLRSNRAQANIWRRHSMAEATLERQLPQNLDGARRVLGRIPVDNNALNTAIEKLKPEDFFSDAHRRIFNYMIQLAEAQQAID